MNNGIVTPSQGYSAEQHWRDFTRGQDQARAHQQHTALGRRLVARGPIDGLPAALVEAARRAVAVETGAQQALRSKVAEATADVARLNMDAAAENYHRRITCGQAERAAGLATQEAERACAALGEVRVSGLRQALREVETRKAEAQRQYQQTLAAIAADEQQAHSELRQLGIE